MNGLDEVGRMVGLVGRAGAKGHADGFRECSRPAGSWMLPGVAA